MQFETQIYNAHLQILHNNPELALVQVYNNQIQMPKIPHSKSNLSYSQLIETYNSAINANRRISKYTYIVKQVQDKENSTKL